MRSAMSAQAGSAVRTTTANAAAPTIAAAKSQTPEPSATAASPGTPKQTSAAAAGARGTPKRAGRGAGGGGVAAHDDGQRPKAAPAVPEPHQERHRRQPAHG